MCRTEYGFCLVENLLVKSHLTLPHHSLFHHHLALYAALDRRPLASRELSLPAIATGATLTQPLSNRASEAVSCAILALTQVNAGQVQQGIASGRRGLALSEEIKNVWTQVLGKVLPNVWISGSGGL